MKMPTPKATLVVAATSLLLSLLPATPVNAQDKAEYQKQARVMTNNKRADHDAGTLDKGKCVQTFARRQARKMAAKELMFHQDLGKVLDACGLTKVGENVAYGYPTGKAAVKAWMNSPGHRENLLEPAYEVLGMAVRRDDDGTTYAVQVFGRS